MQAHLSIAARSQSVSGLWLSAPHPAISQGWWLLEGRMVKRGAGPQKKEVLRAQHPDAARHAAHPL